MVDHEEKVAARMLRPLLVLVLAVSAFGQADPGPGEGGESDVASCLPEDIPGGRDQAAKALKSGVPQLVRKALEDLVFAQEKPAFAPWRAALEGRAGGSVVDAWTAYLAAIFEREIECREFRAEATAWLESRNDLEPGQSAILAAGLFHESAHLAKRHEEPAREGNMSALMSLAGNPAGHAFLLDLCRSESPESRKLVYIIAAAHAQSVTFRPLFEEWRKSDSMQISFCGVNGILRLGDPADVKVAAAYLQDPRAIRRFEVYRALSWIKSKEVVDLLLAEQPSAQAMNREAVVVALSRQKDDRILPRLRALRDTEGYTAGVCAALWRQGRAGDVPWLFEKMEAGEPEAGRTLRRLLGKACPIEFAERADGVKKWMAENAAAIEKDGELLKK